MTGPLLTDLHSHFVTPRYVEEAQAAGHELPDGMPWWPTWSVGDQVALMAECGIERALLSISSPGVHFGDDVAAVALARHVNDVAAEVVAADPRRFGFLASLPLPDVDGSVTEAIRAVDELGASGVILLTNAHGRYLGDPALEPLLGLLDERRAVVLVHPTAPPNASAVSMDRPLPMLEFMFETTRSITDLVFAGAIARHPGIRFVIPHCGAALPVLTSRIELFRSIMPGPDGGPAGAATTEDQLRSCWFDLAGFAFPHHAPAAARLVGEDRLVYGSDYCWTPAPSVAQLARELDAATPPASAPDWRTLLQRNARALLTD